MNLTLPYLAVPTYDGRIDIRTHESIDSFRRSFPSHGFSREICSLLAYSFNRLYADALNRRAQYGFTHFVMLHADVAPQNAEAWLWGRRLIELMHQNNLGALSAAVMVKDDSGETSTAVDLPDGTVERLTAAEVGPMLTSRDKPNLLINTGCLVIDLTKPWSDKVYFHIKDAIRKTPEGVYEAVVHPEDWELSRMFKRMGVAFGATTEIKTRHCSGHGVWSTEDAHEPALAGAVGGGGGD
jgi:hypothetical protein